MHTQPSSERCERISSQSIFFWHVQWAPFTSSPPCGLLGFRLSPWAVCQVESIHCKANLELINDQPKEKKPSITSLDADRARVLTA